MKNGISLRVRLTLITSMLLTLLCITFTISGFYNLNVNVIDPLQLIIQIDMDQIDHGLEEAISEIRLSNLNDIIIKQAVLPYSRFSLLFMFVSIIIGTGIMYFLSGLVLKPAKKLAMEIASKNKDTLFNPITDFKSGDELNSIANSFNEMLERLQLAFEREQRFSAAAAHELKTPLTIIKTNLDVFDLFKEDTQEEISDTFCVVKKQTNRMIILVNSLMTLYGTEKCDKNDVVFIHELLLEIGDEMLPDMKRKFINLNLDLDSFSIRGNMVMIKHAISNVWSNAIRYNIESGEIVVSTYKDEKDCVISISDTGIEIEEDSLRYIFEPFYRVDKSRSRESGGSGLGLAIAKEIIKDHGGTINYEKNNPIGSRFIIRLPML